MVSTLHRLTVRQVQGAAPGRSLSDGGGLYYRATAKGTGRWTFRFTSTDQEYLAAQAAKGSSTSQREMGLGSFPAVGLVLARSLAAKAREAVSCGQDPIKEITKAEAAAQEAARVAAKQDAEKKLTFGHYADNIFLPAILPNFSNPAHVAQWRATFTTDAVVLRNMPLVSITRKDVLAVLRPIWNEKNVTASRSRGRIERLFAHAIQNGHFSHDNPAAWRQFDATLPAPRKLTRGHHPSIPHDTIAGFMSAVRAKQANSMAALMLEWITLAACRTGEARFATWGEIDLERKVWSIPAERMKMRRGHMVPITGRMAEILMDAKHRRFDQARPESFVFPGPKGGAMSELAALVLMQGLAGYQEYTTHGLRASFKSWAASDTEFPRELIEEQLAHQLGEVERAYMRGSTVERRRGMMEQWARHCEGGSPAVGADNVVPLRKV